MVENTPHIFPLTDLQRELRNAGYVPGRVTPTYRKAIELVADGQLPVVKIGHRYFPRRSDLAAIARLFDMSGGPTEDNAAAPEHAHHNPAIAA